MFSKFHLGFVAVAAVSLITGQARKGFGPGDQEWGYVTVRPGAHMFWWLYYATSVQPPSVGNDKPLIIWLQGGPGLGSSGIGNFMEFGPLDVDLQLRNLTWVQWVKDHNVLLIDNPVGSGFSYVDESANGTFATNNSEIVKDLITCLREFYVEFPQFRTVPTYILAQSYGAKMAVEFAWELHKAEKVKEIQINLKGIGLGGGWISPEDTINNYAPYLYYTGMADKAGRDKVQEFAERTKESIQKERWEEAYTRLAQLSVIRYLVTNYADFYNILRPGPIESNMTPLNMSAVVNLMNSKVKPTLELVVKWGDQSDKVLDNLINDHVRPVFKIVEKLLNETDIKVTVFNGQLDLIVNLPGTLDWLEKLNWKDADKWKKTPRYPIENEHGKIELFVREYGNLAFYWVHRAGHVVPMDNPVAMSIILKRLITTSLFDSNLKCKINESHDGIENQL